MNILLKIIGLLCLGVTLTATAQELAPEQLCRR